MNKFFDINNQNMYTVENIEEKVVLNIEKWRKLQQLIKEESTLFNISDDFN